MEFVFEIDASKQNDLKKVLEFEPYADDSFSRLGYALKDSSAVGLPAGKTVLYFKCVEQEKAKKLVEKLVAVEGLTEVSGEDKQKIVSVINSEEESAAAGFGSIFG